jgi:hypothetical protein
VYDDTFTQVLRDICLVAGAVFLLAALVACFAVMLVAMAEHTRARHERERRVSDRRYGPDRRQAAKWN